MIAAVESILSQMEATEKTKSLIRHQASSFLMTHSPREVLSKVERDALRELKADKDLVIVPADTGRSTVVLDRADYLQKAKGSLEDRQFYVPCATNPLKTLTREINALALENSGAITPTDRRMARPQDTALARFYGLPKVHKDGAPLRPIVLLKGTLMYGLAKWLFQRLKFLTAESDTTVSSSAQFLEKLKGDLAIETIELLLQSKYDETENRLVHAQVLQLLEFCLRTYFTFDGTIYEEVKGTPMGSPISGFIAEAVLQRLESLVFQHHKPKFWARDVDDTFVVIDRDQLLTFKEHLNAVFPDIQFTMEEEVNDKLAFLDVLVCRKDCGGLKTKVFTKATNTMQVLNFNSNHPISHKRSCVRTLYRRVETHCSEPEDKIAELQYLRRVFKANGYPRNFVSRCIRKRDERPNRTDTKFWRALPHIKNFSEAIDRLLAPGFPEAAVAGDIALVPLLPSSWRWWPWRRGRWQRRLHKQLLQRQKQIASASSPRPTLYVASTHIPSLSHGLGFAAAAGPTVTRSLLLSVRTGDGGAMAGAVRAMMLGRGHHQHTQRTLTRAPAPLPSVAGLCPSDDDDGSGKTKRQRRRWRGFDAHRLTFCKFIHLAIRELSHLASPAPPLANPRQSRTLSPTFLASSIAPSSSINWPVMNRLENGAVGANELLAGVRKQKSYGPSRVISEHRPSAVRLPVFSSEPPRE
ncbi:hypothetical protein SprV_0100258200 [Sparganum proliferum]